MAPWAGCGVGCAAQSLMRKASARGTMVDEDEVELREGMPVANEAGDKLGVLAALLIAEDEEEAEFLILKAGDDERLVPFEAVLGVGDGELVLDVPANVVTQYPAVTADQEPSDEQMELAYKVYDETAEYAEVEP